MTEIPEPPPGFRPEEMAVVAEALGDLEPLGPPLAAFLGGSKAFGLGNALSDVDLTVIYDDAVADDQQQVRSYARDGVMLHREIYGLSDYDMAVRLFARGALPDEAASIAAEAVLGKQRRINELVRGPSLVTSPTIEALRAELPLDKVDGLCAAAAAMIGSLSVRDAAGAAESGDWLTAVAAAEIALEHALDAALFAAGDTYRSRKFLPRRLSDRPELAGFVADLRSGPLPAGDPAALERMARDMLLVANGLQAATLLSTGPVWARRPDGPGPRRSPWSSLVATDAGLRLAGIAEARLGRPAAVLWLLADGRPVPDLAARFAAVHGLRAEDVTTFVEANVESLRAALAVEDQ